MTAPDYEWVCFKCQGANCAGASVCQACGFSAYPTGKELDQLSPKPAYPPPQPSAITSDDVLLFSRN